MQISVCSKSNKYTWARGGRNIDYMKTNIKTDQRHFYSLSFDFDFMENNDITYFSYCFPYTYSQLDKFLFHV
jgi:hypothetical protein